MTEAQKIADCYEMAELILKPYEEKKSTSLGVQDPLAYVCLAELLYNWKYNKHDGKTKTISARGMGMV